MAKQNLRCTFVGPLLFLFIFLLLPLWTAAADTTGVSERELLDLQAQEIICNSLVPYNDFINHMDGPHALSGADAIKNAHYDCATNPGKTIGIISETGDASYFFDVSVSRSFNVESENSSANLPDSQFVSAMDGPSGTDEDSDNPFGGGDENDPLGNGDGNAGGDDDCDCTPPDIKPAQAALKKAKDALAAAKKALDAATAAYKNNPTEANFQAGMTAQGNRDQAEVAVLSAEHDVKIVQAQIDVCKK